MCAHQPASSWRPSLPGTICFQLAASRLGEGPILGQLLRRGPLASSGHPSSAPSKLRLALASMLSQQLWAATQRILFPAASLRSLGPSQTVNLLEIHSETVRPHSQEMGKAGSPFAIKFYFVFLGGKVKGRRALI